MGTHIKHRKINTSCVLTVIVKILTQTPIVQNSKFRNYYMLTSMSDGERRLRGQKCNQVGIIAPRSEWAGGWHKRRFKDQNDVIHFQEDSKKAWQAIAFYDILTCLQELSYTRKDNLALNRKCLSFKGHKIYMNPQFFIILSQKKEWEKCR